MSYFFCTFDHFDHGHINICLYNKDLLKSFLAQICAPNGQILAIAPDASYPGMEMRGSWGSLTHPHPTMINALSTPLIGQSPVNSRLPSNVYVAQALPPQPPQIMSLHPQPHLESPSPNRPQQEETPTVS